MTMGTRSARAPVCRPCASVRSAPSTAPPVPAPDHATAGRTGPSTVPRYPTRLPVAHPTFTVSSNAPSLQYLSMASRT